MRRLIVYALKCKCYCFLPAAERNRQKVEQAQRKIPPTKVNPKAGGFGKPASIPAPKPKDPQKTLGQKSAIKLTLLKVGLNSFRTSAANF